MAKKIFLFIMLKIFNSCAIFSSEAQMKNFPRYEKENNEKVPAKIEQDTDYPENVVNPAGNISCIQIMEMIKKDRKFFNISAKLSIYSS